MTILRIRYKQLGGHVHCRVFVGTSFTGTFQKAGDFTLDAGSMWEDFCLMMQSVQVGENVVQIKHEDELMTRTIKLTITVKDVDEHTPTGTDVVEQLKVDLSDIADPENIEVTLDEQTDKP